MDGILNHYNLKSTFEQEIVSRVIFMQDGAPPHFCCFVTDVLNERFPDVWIGRGGPIPWPSRSPDLSPLDFFLWRYIKNIVYAEKIRNTRRRYVVKHNLITEVYLMNVMENNYMFRPVLAIIRLSMELKG